MTSQSEDDTKALGRELGELLQGGDIILLDGDLGAGKTRFAKGVAEGLGAQQSITSPTFNLVLEYLLSSNKREGAPKILRHYDLYRLESSEQLDDLDYFGLLEDVDAVSLVEWGRKFSDSLPLEYLLIHITTESADSALRTLQVSAEGARPHELLTQLVAARENEQHA